MGMKGSQNPVGLEAIICHLQQSGCFLVGTQGLFLLEAIKLGSAHPRSLQHPGQPISDG